MYFTTHIPGLRIIIRSVEHSQQRYDTCGDYYDNDAIAGGKILNIVVSELADRREMILIALHELVEWALCQSKGVPNESIDAFDLAYRGSGEPGDDPAAPYYSQHQIATGIERIIAAEMGVSWTAFSQHILELKR